MCDCGLGHRGWERNLCRIKLAKTTHTNVSPRPKKPLLGDPSDPVSVKNPKKQIITGNVSGNTSKQSIGVSGNAKRQAALKSKRVANGLMRVEVWTHPDHIQAIKAYAKKLNE